MAEKSPAKKFLIFVSIFLGGIAIVGAVVGTSMERRLPGELRPSVFKGLKPGWLGTYTFGNPEMLESELAKVDYEMFYTDRLKGKDFKLTETSGTLVAADSQFNVQLKEGDRLVFFSHGEKTGAAEVASLTAPTEVQLAGVHIHHHGPTPGHDEPGVAAVDAVRLYRPFTGTAYRFYGKPGVDGVDTVYESLKAPDGYHFNEEGELMEGNPVEHGGHGGHGGGHGGGYGESYTYSPTVRPGHFQAYYESWPLGKFYRHVRYRCQYREGIKDGVEEYFQANGHCEWRKTWKAGTLDGVFEEWFPSGAKKLSAAYAGGKLEGEYIAFHTNGEKKIKTHYHNGELDGRFESWNIHKNRLFNKKYENGKEVPEKTGGSSSKGH